MSDSRFGELSERFRLFAEFEARRSSRLYEQLCAGATDRREVLALLAEAPSAQRRPNLLLAAVHDLLLQGADHPLRAYYPSVGGAYAPDAAAVDLFTDFCQTHAEQLRATLRTRSTQTNEVARSGAVLAALSAVTPSQALALIDVGAAGGLNLLLDRYTYRIDDGERIGAPASPVEIAVESLPGRPLPALTLPRVAQRVGVDLVPLDVRDADDARWLRACVWPEHRERRALLDAALDIARRNPPEVVAGDAVEMLPGLLERADAAAHPVVLHCATLTYLDEDARSRFAELLERAGAARDLTWIALEAPFMAPFADLDRDASAPRPAEAYFLLSATTWRAGERRDALLGRAHPHGRWVQWLGASG